MTPRNTLPPELLRELLRYEPRTGRLFWKKRKPHHFQAGATRSAEHICALWNARYAGKEALCQPHKLGYRHGFLLGTNRKAHRVIFAMQTGRWPFEVDHDNGIRSDNRWRNLREKSSRSEQMKNQRRRRDNTSGVVGVCRDRSTWRATIGTTRIGNFPTLEAAAAARRAAEEAHGYHPNHGRR